MRIKYQVLFCYLFVFSMILGGTVEITHLDYISTPSPTLLLGGMLLIVSLCIITERELILSKRILVSLTTIILYLTVYCIASWYNVSYYFVNFFLVIVFFFLYSYLLVRSNRISILFNAYVNIFVAIAVISLFFWLFGSILNLIPGKIGTFSINGYQSRSVNYFYLYFENYGQNQNLLGSTIARNCGWYCEAPAYAGMLFYALLIEFLYNKQRNKFKMFILIITLISTQSSKALILLMALFVINYLLNQESGKRKAILRWAFSLLIILAVAWATSVILEDKASTYSYAARIQHLRSSVVTWLQQPIFGAGYKNADAIFQNQIHGEGYGGLSMGIMVLLAQGGLFLFLFYLGAIVYGYRSYIVRKNRVAYITCVITLSINLFISNSAFSYPYLLMTALCYVVGSIPEKAYLARKNVMIPAEVQATTHL